MSSALTALDPHERGDTRIDLAREPNFSLSALSIPPSLREVVAQVPARLQPRIVQALVVLAAPRGPRPHARS